MSAWHYLTDSLHPLSLLSQNNIEPCPECGHLKQKHVLCGFCYTKVSRETSLIRQQIKAMEGGPLRAPATETVVLYEGETPSQQDKDKRIVERGRKRPAWFIQWCWVITAVRRCKPSVWCSSGQIHTDSLCDIVSSIFFMICYSVNMRCWSIRGFFYKQNP